ncbi:response regulator transcription factor [Persicobacter diffluens]|uniref:Phosphate regulon transcriptional regulatory protein PhoB n=1 Tax=Persicobacter diffluens TaxID=981 RepID=A0AAN5AMN9_9BACT|nr:DNA-binding response regulator [Persicobacter diffluens]
MKKVLIIEDDPEIVQLLTIHLKDLNCECQSADNGADGLKMALMEDFDLIILDVSLPQMDGIEVCKNLRSEKATPIIMLTAKSEEIDRVLGLEMGADDYMTKPFSLREFIARVKAIFRRTQMIAESLQPLSPHLEYDNISIQIEKRKVMVAGKKVELSPKEFDLLVLMASHPGRNYSRSDLLKLIWGYDFEGYEHTVNSHINRLRSKIEPDMTNPTYILTTWGVGYKFNEEL